MKFKDRYDKILKDNNLGVQEVVKLTGISRAVYYRMMSETASKKYDVIEKLFNICENDEQIYFLATGKHLQSSDINVGNTMQVTINALTAAMDAMRIDLMRQIDELRSEIKKLEEGKQYVRAAGYMQKHPQTERP
jgi:hypothetical protein